MRNILAGATAAVVSLPLSIGLGALAMAPLGPEYVGWGVMAGLHAAAFMSLVAVLAGARGIAIYAPRGLVTFSIASVVATTFVGASWLQGQSPYMVVSAMLLMLAMVGVLQLVFATARLPRLVKYLPAPVMAGFQNAAAIAIMASQIPVLLGLPSGTSVMRLPELSADIHLLGAALGALTLAIVFLSPRVLRRGPPLLIALFIGTLLYHLIDWYKPGAVGGVVGALESVIPDGRELAGIMAVTQLPGFAEALPKLALGALSIAIVASLDVVLNAKLVENLSGQRRNSTQELLCTGTANTIAPLLGGIAGSISLAPTMTNFQAGARSSLSLLAHGLVALALIVFAAPILGYIPKAVIGALLFYAGMQLVDRWSVQLLRRVFKGRTVQWRTIAIDLLVIALVASVALTGQLAAAVGLGVLISVIVFTVRMSQGVMRRVRFADVLRSRRSRPARELELLAASGRRIMCIELEGPVFFASAEQLQNHVDDAAADGSSHIIVDLERVTEIDSTGAQLFVQVAKRLQSRGAVLVLSGLTAESRVVVSLQEQGVLDAIEALGAGRLQPDLDRALEWCESAYLSSTASERGRDLIALEQIDLFQGLEEDERSLVASIMSQHSYATGETVFSEGEEGDALFIIVRGAASVRIALPVGDRRLVTFAPGTVFGEMALLDRQKRSATIRADEELLCYALSRARFDQLALDQPKIAMMLMANIAREMSHRLRTINRAHADGLF
jgi:sulfate permease, SulP family